MAVVLLNKEKLFWAPIHRRSVERFIQQGNFNYLWQVIELELLLKGGYSHKRGGNLIKLSFLPLLMNLVSGDGAIPFSSG